MSQTRINIKGTSYGLVIQIGPGDWGSLLTELESRLEQTPSFFKGGRVALHIGPRQLTQFQLEHVGDLLKSHQMSLWAVVGEAEETRQRATSLGLETKLASSQALRPAQEETRRAGQDEHKAILIRRTLRSGQSLRHAGHVVVIGDVNPGAEIIAGGDVVVWGRLRGIVHAGAGGDDSAVVCALALAPMQLRISRHIARSPGGDSGEGQVSAIGPEVASVQDGQIVVELWGTK
ncbi:MAG: septum site-determining protein MinC [Anaerolineales bacterium]|nr:MAG: septum site-determining protein MinC [Anaerolineales bacterium]